MTFQEVPRERKNGKEENRIEDNRMPKEEKQQILKT